MSGDKKSAKPESRALSGSAPVLTIPRNSAIEGGDSETGHHFHYSRAERLKLAEAEDCAPGDLPAAPRASGIFSRIFTKNRSLLITVVDLAILAILLVLFLTVFKPNLGKDSFGGGYEASLEAFAFQGEVLVATKVRAPEGSGADMAAGVAVSAPDVGIGFFLFDDAIELPSREDLRKIPLPNSRAAGMVAEMEPDTTGLFATPPIASMFYRDLLPETGTREFSAKLPVPAGPAIEKFKILVVIWQEGQANSVILTSVDL